MSYVQRLDSGVGGMTPDRMLQEIDLLRRVRSEHLWRSSKSGKSTATPLRDSAGGQAWLILRRGGREIDRGTVNRRVDRE